MAQHYAFTFPPPKYQSRRQPIVKRTYRQEIKTKETTVRKWPIVDIESSPTELSPILQTVHEVINQSYVAR